MNQTKEELTAFAEANGIKIDGRWGKERIKEAIDSVNIQMEDQRALESSPVFTPNDEESEQEERPVIAAADMDSLTFPQERQSLEEEAKEVMPRNFEPMERLTSDGMNEIALRIWESQSPDLNHKERVARVKLRLERMGFDDFSGLELPGPLPEPITHVYACLAGFLEDTDEDVTRYECLEEKCQLVIDGKVSGSKDCPHWELIRVFPNGRR